MLKLLAVLLLVVVMCILTAAVLSTALLAQVAAFLYLLFVDYRLQLGGLISPRYLRIRTIATALAVVSLVVIVAIR